MSGPASPPARRSSGRASGWATSSGRPSRASTASPEAFDQTRTLMFLGIGLVEAQALFGLVFALLVAFVL